jgi:hypothetical protein
MQLAVMEFGPTLLVFEVRGLVGKSDGYPQVVTNEYYTTEGVIKGGQFYAKGSTKGEKLEAPEVRVAPGGAFGAFINAMRTRKPEDNNCDAETAHYSAACCHLPNISYRLGQTGSYDKAKGAIGNNAQVVEVLEKIRDNTKAAIGTPVDQTEYTIGRVLTFDPASEQFTGEGSDQANKLLTREYRAPFVVPSEV